MKPHLIIRLVPQAASATATAPAWSDAVRDKSGVGSRLHPEIDRVFDRHRVGVLVTAEYRPRDRSGTWSAQELESGLNRVYRVVLNDDRRPPPDLLRDLAALPVVESVRPGLVARAELPRASALSGGDRTGEAARTAIGLDETRDYSRGDPRILVAVLDTGIALDHPELAGALRPGRDFVDILDGAGQFVGDYLGADDVPDDEVGHGTHVAGIIAGRGIRMPAGVAPRCSVLPVRVLGAMEKAGKRFGAGLLDNINSAVKWAVDQGADVINMSLGVRHEGGGLPHREVVDYARRHGVTIVAASGNDGQRQLYYPGALPHVIAVGAADDKGRVASFSTFGDQVSLIAPGVDIYSTYLEHGYAFSTGTSHAAPFVAGAAALLKCHARSLGRRLTDGQVKHVLKHTADKVGREFKDPKAGFGMLNLRDALRLLDHRLGA
ncbi:peptidase S8 [Skermanella stibiiresistens SB22]|uniref:Peptidase S8 n=1 Tax=Skermanella stibiiresistens SB22 TaxID=1385369 RepID=W9H9G1_9PROT|nr:S8 family serine peptidase [Skermanella stibiiresistens]EWY41327.1 peptidase S8 [Skermanella stibiiresistens SB22]